jgi:hypothetical protein
MYIKFVSGLLEVLKVIDKSEQVMHEAKVSDKYLKIKHRISIRHKKTLPVSGFF